MSVLLGNIPAKYAKAAKEHQLSTLDVMFAMGRGRQRDGVDVEASESESTEVTVFSGSSITLLEATHRLISVFRAAISSAPHPQ